MRQFCSCFSLTQYAATVAALEKQRSQLQSQLESYRTKATATETAHSDLLQTISSYRQVLTSTAGVMKQTLDLSMQLTDSDSIESAASIKDSDDATADQFAMAQNRRKVKGYGETEFEQALLEQRFSAELKGLFELSEALHDVLAEHLRATLDHRQHMSHTQTQSQGEYYFYDLDSAASCFMV